MKISPSKTLKEIADLLQVEYVGKDDFVISGLNEIHMVEPGDIVFVDHPKYYDKALKSKATTILINKKVDCPQGKALLISDDPFRDFNKISQTFSKPTYSLKQIGENVVIDPSSAVHPSVAIGNHVRIGKNCTLHPNVTIYGNTTIGDNVIIHANTVIGGHAFYYKKRATHFDPLKSVGGVVIENDVEIGALCSIDKGVTANTIIGEGTKMDNQVHIGHDVRIGKMCLFAAQVGIAGCVIIEDKVTLWGQVGVPADLTIGAGAVVLGQSGVPKSLEGNKTYFGSPADESRKKMRELALIRKIPDIIERLDSYEQDCK